MKRFNLSFNQSFQSLIKSLNEMSLKYFVAKIYNATQNLTSPKVPQRSYHTEKSVISFES